VPDVDRCALFAVSLDESNELRTSALGRGWLLAACVWLVSPQAGVRLSKVDECFWLGLPSNRWPDRAPCVSVGAAKTISWRCSDTWCEGRDDATAGVQGPALGSSPSGA